MWYSHTIEYYSAIERNEVLIHTTTWMKTLCYLKGYGHKRSYNV